MGQREQLGKEGRMGTVEEKAKRREKITVLEKLRIVVKQSLLVPGGATATPV